ncbi:MAG: aldehyde ferredoxin oxidoreductase family protein [Firmicutes bacterium]|nr:aldehyde ferredoxin oxidoreductase family protein [Bacillota bacterium]
MLPGSKRERMYGWARAALTVDLCSGKIERIVPEESVVRKWLGGRGWNGHLLWKMTDASTDPLGPGNPLIFSVGPLTGTLAPGSARYQVTGKSPLTGIFGDANSGGFFGPEMKFCGLDQIVVTGYAETPVYLFVTDEKAELRVARHLWGKTTWETEEAIRSEIGSDLVRVAAIGPAGENLVKFAGIINDTGRAAARTGLGAVMGSKRLKAIALLGNRGVSVSLPDEWDRYYRRARDHIAAAPAYPMRSRFGTTMLIDTYQLMGVLPSYNNRSGVFARAEDIGCKTLEKRFVKRLIACFCCPVRCSRYYSIEEGPYKGTHGEGPEFETLASLGSRCGNSDVEGILALNSKANQLGIDTISLGGVLGFVMECCELGLIRPRDFGSNLDCVPWGDVNSMMQLMEDIAYRRGFGDVLAEGVRNISMKIPGSQPYALHVKGLEIPEQEIRALKAWGLGWAVSSRGADHLRAFPVAETTLTPAEAKALFGTDEVCNRFSYRGKGRLVKWSEDLSAVSDSLSMCKFVTMSMALPAEVICGLLRAVTGVEYSPEELFPIGERIVNLERLYNLRLGLGRDDDTVPSRFVEEALPEGPSAGHRFQLEPMLDEYYSARGWGSNGRPLPARLAELGLSNLVTE